MRVIDSIIFFNELELLEMRLNILNDVVDTFESDGVEEAQNQCEAAVGPVANLFYNALEKADDGVEAAEKTLDQTGTIEMASLEKNMTWISLCIATAPLSSLSAI